MNKLPEINTLSSETLERLGSEYNRGIEDEILRSGGIVTDTRELLDANKYIITPYLGELHYVAAMAKEMSENKGMECPEIVVVDHPDLNTVYAGYKRIWFSRHSLETSDQQKLDYLVAHELGHVAGNHWYDRENCSHAERRARESQADEFAATLVGTDAVISYHREILRSHVTAIKETADTPEVRKKQLHRLVMKAHLTGTTERYPSHRDTIRQLKAVTSEQGWDRN